MSFVKQKIIPVGLLFLTLTGVFTLVAIDAKADPAPVVLTQHEKDVADNTQYGICAYLTKINSLNGFLLVSMSLQERYGTGAESAAKIISYSVNTVCPQHKPLLNRIAAQLETIVEKEKGATI